MNACVRPLIFAAVMAATGLRAETFEVTRGDDPAPDGCLAGDCSLREALEAAQATPAADTVRLGEGQYFVTRGDLGIFGGVGVQGAGSGVTGIIASGTPAAWRIAAQSDFELRGVRFVANSGTAIAADRDHTSMRLVDVEVPTGEVGAGDDGSLGEVHLRVQDSSIGFIVGCIAAQGLCEVIDSAVGMVGALGEQVGVRVVRSAVSGPDGGVIAYGLGEVLIEDSTISGAARPLEAWQLVAGDAPDVWVRRTRFIGNSGPIAFRRDATIHLDDVEFRDNVVAGDALADGAPAVLQADDVGAWRINRALFVGNRGGAALDGAVVRVLGGANVVMNQVTFDDNTFHPDAGGGYGHTIGVYADSADPILLWLLHATLRASTTLPAGTAGSLLTVRGGTANVRLLNTLVAGSCAFGGGGALFQAEGNIESPADTCDMDPGSNEVGMPAIQLHLGQLGDHGGFTRTFMPALGSFLIDAAKSTWCAISPLDQRRYLRPAGGIECDIGAVEADALADAIFADGF